MRRFWLVPTIPAVTAVATYIFTTRYQDQATMSEGATADKYEGLTVEKKNGVFECAWKNFPQPSLGNLAKWKTWEKDESGVPKNKEELASVLPVRPVKDLNNPPADKVQVTWIGHATVLVQFDGINILSDPIFSEYAGLMQGRGASVAGYKRYTKPACPVKELPRIDVVIISHDHYDHLDKDSVIEINKCFPNVKWFAGMGISEWLCEHAGCNKDNVTELIWWQSSIYLQPQTQGQSDTQSHSEVATSASQGSEFEFVCVPAQHWCSRQLVDKNQRLWCGWVVKGPTQSYYFAGDTGYHETLFKKIGEIHGPFSLSAIPIGAYKPRYIMTYQHVTPEEAVYVHEDVRSEQSIGIHWGTFSMANEWYLEPPNALHNKMEELREMKKEKGEDFKPFVSLNLGETWKVGEQRDLPKFIGEKQPPPKTGWFGSTPSKV